MMPPAFLICLKTKTFVGAPLVNSVFIFLFVLLMTTIEVPKSKGQKKEGEKEIDTERNKASFLLPLFIRAHWYWHNDDTMVICL